MARIQLEIEDAAQRMTLKAVLEAKGHTLVAADPEVVFHDSIERARSEAGRVPSIVLATASQIPEAVRAMQEGVWGYIFVPLQADEAGQMVRRAVASQRGASGEDGSAEGNLKTLEQVEQDYIEQVVRACKHNQARAARVLGIGRNTLWRKLKKTSTAVKEDAPE